MSNNKSRRSFFKTAVAGSAFLSSVPGAQAQQRKFKRKNPASNEMIEVGIITCGALTHTQGSWGIHMNPPMEEHFNEMWTKATGMVMTMVWDEDPKVAESFGKKYNVKVAKNYYDMVGKVDAVIVGGYYEGGWYPQLTKPYLEAGLPCLINRPFAISLKDAKEMIERSKKYNALIYVPSAFETRLETVQLKMDLEKLLEEGAHIIGAFLHQGTGDYPAHGVHGLYAMYSILNPKVKAASLQADALWRFDSAYMTWRCEQEDFTDYYVGFNMGRATTCYKVITSGGTIESNVSTGVDIVTRILAHNYPNVYHFQRMIETGKMPQTHDYILGKTKVFLTGFYSHCEKNGQMVNCSDLPEDWRAPEVHPDLISDDIFR